MRRRSYGNTAGTTRVRISSYHDRRGRFALTVDAHPPVSTYYIINLSMPRDGPALFISPVTNANQRWIVHRTHTIRVADMHHRRMYRSNSWT